MTYYWTKTVGWKYIEILIHFDALVEGGIQKLVRFMKIQFYRAQLVERMDLSVINSEVYLVLVLPSTAILQGSLNYQPKQCTIVREILQTYNRFALFDTTKMGNLMTPVY